MALQETLLNLLQGNSILLFLALIVVFVIAYKVLKLLIQTSIVVVLSGFFYVALNYLGLNIEITIPNVMLFMLVGGLLYIVYSLVALVASGAIKLFGGVSKLLKKPIDNYKEKKRDKKDKEDKKSKEKEVVLQKLKEGDEDA